MKHVKDLIPSTLTPQSSTGSTELPFSIEQKQVIQELFHMMKAAWGNKYTTTFKAQEDVRLAMRLWLRAFGRSNSDTLRSAMLRAIDELEWPPTVAEFREYVKAHVAQAQGQTPLLPRPKRNQKLREQWRKEIRERFGY